jgi:hypothetical protein
MRHHGEVLNCKGLTYESSFSFWGILVISWLVADSKFIEWHHLFDPLTSLSFKNFEVWSLRTSTTTLKVDQPILIFSNPHLSFWYQWKTVCRWIQSTMIFERLLSSAVRHQLLLINLALVDPPAECGLLQSQNRKLIFKGTKVTSGVP